MAVLAVGLAALGFAGSASAHTGEWAVFNNCPSTNPSAFKCLHSVTNGGTVKLGKKVVPIVNPVTVQGGLTEEAFEGPEEGFARMIAATNGETLSKTPQPVPGGLAGLVNCPEISNFLVRLGCEAIFENGLTGVNATLELAKPASEIKLSQNNLAFESGTALLLPVKVHLENPLLGSGCYIGSSSSPLIWNLTTGTTTPPAGVTPLTGKGGTLSFTEKSQIAHITGSSLVENNWAAPGASGCGGFGVELILNPILNSQVGVPSAAGVNEAKLEKVNTDLALAEQVNKH
ncbi:MAG: hypothetical protein ACRDPE_11330 [Solirubrobacterales bacterium]